ncbi:hypothetical protein QVD99_008209 [Batrachochytrium dendrobatidis]|nr:hypothetical protein O5D80_007494 [Batrachochytrium dendrobatidis]KAK5664658.1 hypothetical protein QVD99_008209 [Batrachochytrium dendrobatidis]
MLTIVPHIAQSYSWDCGLACTSMVLAGLGIPRSTLLDVSNMCSTRSIWTVDLVYIFRHYGVQDFTMYTSYIGVNWQNASKPFYRDSIAEDLKRVHSLFAKARACQVRIVPLVLAMDDICRFLASNRYAIIILVNFNLLKCTTCSKNKAKTSVSWLQWLFGRCYSSQDKIDDVAGFFPEQGIVSNTDNDELDDDGKGEEERNDPTQSLLGAMSSTSSQSRNLHNRIECRTPPLRSPDRHTRFSIPNIQQPVPTAPPSAVAQQQHIPRDRRSSRSLYLGIGTNTSSHNTTVDAPTAAESSPRSISGASMVSSLSAKFFPAAAATNSLAQPTNSGTLSQSQFHQAMVPSLIPAAGDTPVPLPTSTVSTLPATMTRSNSGSAGIHGTASSSSAALPTSPKASGFLASPLRLLSHPQSPVVTQVGTSLSPKRESVSHPTTPSHSPTKQVPSPRFPISLISPHAVFGSGQASISTGNTATSNTHSCTPTTCISTNATYTSCPLPSSNQTTPSLNSQSRDPSLSHPTAGQQRTRQTSISSSSLGATTTPSTQPLPTPAPLQVSSRCNYTRPKPPRPCLPCLAFRNYKTIYDQQNEFEGHYIVLIGYDAARDVVYYRDPGVSDTLCSVKVDCLDKARMSCGTDCDLIVVKVM